VWPGWSGLTRDITRFIAQEGRTYAVAASGLLSLDDAPADFPMLDEIKAQYPNELFDGGSGIVGPDGNWIAGPVIGSEEVLVADIDPRVVAEERLMFDVAGHYSRPDVFESRVHRTRQRAAIFDTES
jgi:nitrilase